MIDEWQKRIEANSGRVTAFDVNLEQAAEESAQDRRDHARLRALVDELSKHEDVMRVPVAVRRLVDDVQVDHVVIAKTLLIGDREGGILYKLTARTAALAEHERAAEALIAIAIRDLHEDIAVQMMLVAAVWVITQCGVDRSFLTSFLTSDLSRRPVRADRRGCGALDLADADGHPRARLVETIENAQLPPFAPLELRRLS
jgi:hypothetical protein